MFSTAQNHKSASAICTAHACPFLQLPCSHFDFWTRAGKAGAEVPSPSTLIWKNSTRFKSKRLLAYRAARVELFCGESIAFKLLSIEATERERRARGETRRWNQGTLTL